MNTPDELATLRAENDAGCEAHGVPVTVVPSHETRLASLEAAVQRLATEVDVERRDNIRLGLELETVKAQLTVLTAVPVRTPPGALVS